MAGSTPKRVFAVGDLSYYGPKAEASTSCRDCGISDRCPDYYNIFDFAHGFEFINRLKLIGEEHGQEPGDLCLFNSKKDTFDNGMAIVTYENGIKACYTLNVAGARTTRQMRILGDLATLEADLEKGIIVVTDRHTSQETTIDTNKMMKGSHSGADILIIKDFLSTVREGKKPITGWAEGKLSIQVSLAARDSMDTGQVVDI